MSPGGLSYIGRSKEVLGEIPAAIACKRIHLDEAIAKAAQRYFLFYVGELINLSIIISKSLVQVVVGLLITIYIMVL